MRQCLVIGYGNTLRQDDGVGPKVAEAVSELALPGLEGLAAPQLTPELADLVAKAKCVVFVDATFEGSTEAEVRPLGAAESSQVIAHACDPRTILALARDVFGYAPPAWLVTIPARNFQIGEELSPLAQLGVRSALAQIRALARCPSAA